VNKQFCDRAGDAFRSLFKNPLQQKAFVLHKSLSVYSLIVTSSKSSMEPHLLYWDALAKLECAWLGMKLGDFIRGNEQNNIV